MLERLKLGILLASTVIVAYGLIGGLMLKVSAGDEAYRDLSVFTTVFSKVENDYVEKPDMSKAMNGALHGMMEALDPFSSFVDAETYEALDGKENGADIGLVLSKRYSYGYVVAVSPVGPAHDNGIRVGDLIESIDGAPTVLMSLWEAEHRLRGPAGSEVKLRVIRSRRSEPQDVVLVRAEPADVDIVARVVEQDLGYVRIPDMETGTAETVAAKLRMLLAADVKGLLIDLRNAASGTLEEGVALADLFLPVSAPIVEIQARSGGVVKHVSMREPMVKDLPVVLLVDGGTSGVAEVFTAGLLDNKVAFVMGERTNGHGSIQERFVLEDGSVLLISTQLLVRADGTRLQDNELRNSGIEPELLSPSRDFVTNFYFDNVSEDDADLDEAFYRRLDEAVETEQYNNAVEQLRQKVDLEQGAQEAA